MKKYIIFLLITFAAFGCETQKRASIRDAKAVARLERNGKLAAICDEKFPFIPDSSSIDTFAIAGRVRDGFLRSLDSLVLLADNLYYEAEKAGRFEPIEGGQPVITNDCNSLKVRLQKSVEINKRLAYEINKLKQAYNPCTDSLYLLRQTIFQLSTAKDGVRKKEKEADQVTIATLQEQLKAAESRKSNWLLWMLVGGIIGITLMIILTRKFA